MFKCFRIGVLVVALFPVGGGVAAAYPNVANVDQSKDVDGWHLRLRITEITIESVPNIAATPTSREGFVTATVTEDITRINPGEPPAENTNLTAGFIVFKAVMGCQWTADNMIINPNDYPVGPTASTTLTPGSPPSIAVGAQTNGDAEPLFQLQVNPGQIKEPESPEKKEFILKDKTMNDEEATRGPLTRVISVEKEHVFMDGCGGPVVIRLEAEGMMSTMRSDSHLTAYSDIVPL